MRAASLVGVIGGLYACALPIPASATANQTIVLCVSLSDRHPGSASMAVSYSDLDLRLPEARRILNRRIEAAAGQLCWKVVDTHFLDYHVTCRRQAIYDVRDQVRRAEARAELGIPAS